ncbi:MAG TPA: hypothetical protein VMK13_16730 [Streptosporangiaceae bacterium]|nr:hypothetical protein [Streptosporangiaceae bacterium]
MPQSPRARRPAPRRLGLSRLAPAAAAAAIGLSMLVLAGCGQMDAALSQQAAVVTFRASTSVAAVLQVRQACSHVPNVKAAPIKRTETALDVINALRYNTSNASDANLAELQQCLQKFPSVQGIDFSDVSDNG